MWWGEWEICRKEVELKWNRYNMNQEVTKWTLM